MTPHILLTLSLLILAAVFNGCMDLLQFNYYTSVFARLPRLKNWLDPEHSWKNKYKKTLTGELTQRPAFWGSTTFLVWLTDGWHFFQLLMWSSLQAALALHFSLTAPIVHYPIVALLCDVLLFKILMGSFETLILKILRKST